MRSKVFILYTGGTFGMRPDPKGDGLSPGSWDELLSFMPAVEQNGFFNFFEDVEFSFHTLDQVVDSSNVGPALWKEIAGIVKDHYEEHTGFVIIHGTDTMAYTASALSFVFENLAKPVIITGSQLPVFHPRTDGITNLSNAIYLAAYPSFGLECIPEVALCFNDVLLRGNRASKQSTYDLAGFSSNNYPVLARLEQEIEIDRSALLPMPTGPLALRDRFSSAVVNVTVFPGYDPGVVLDLVQKDRIQGIVLKTFGAGNIPSDPTWDRLVRECEQKGVLILATTQCPNGSIDLGKYQASQPLLSPVVIDGKDIGTEAALSKMMWAIGNFGGAERRHFIADAIRGEMTVRN